MKAEKNILPDLSTNRYTVSIAQTEEEIEEALKLRYDVFYEELHREFSSAEKIDQDEYDDQCHHLIVKENSTKKVIGTYRLQTYEQAVAGKGFYSETLFNLQDLPSEVLTESFEVGRACINEEHRSGRVLFLLWKGFAAYLQAFDKRYLLGSLGIPAKSPDEGIAIYKKLKDNGDLHDSLLVSAKKPYRHNPDTTKISKKKQFDGPGLLQNYLSIGCKIISKPAYHEELELFYVMIFLDVKDLNPRTKKMFFG